ncbi:hypothetical protein B0H14DRAFT_3438286 [Mycena olivaceomarginata]|nr:hypothetical protein B0H14DRAFT_3438286 [Mycena olivaceomarginata]
MTLITVCQVKYGIEEWSTGVFIPAKGFYEKDVTAKETLVPSTLTATSTNIDDAQEVMRDELAGWTGETDGEDENNIAAA